jgi:hypothetical protein
MGTAVKRQRRRGTPRYFYVVSRMARALLDKLEIYPSDYSDAQLARIHAWANWRGGPRPVPVPQGLRRVRWWPYRGRR